MGSAIPRDSFSVLRSEAHHPPLACVGTTVLGAFSGNESHANSDELFNGHSQRFEIPLICFNDL